MGDVEKERAVHDWIVLNVDYDMSSDPPDVSYSAYGALANGKAVCQGYSLLNFKMLSAMGMKVRIVSSNSMNHAWNMVLVCGHWFHEDITWDDPDSPNRIFYDYFNLSDAEISDDEHRHAGWTTDTDPPPPAAPDPFDPEICLVPGDFDGNDMCDLGDLVLALRICAGFSASEIRRDSDTNGDAKVDLVDVLYIIETISGLR